MDNGCAAVAFPDFTRGHWNDVKGFHHAFATPEDEAAAELAAEAATLSLKAQGIVGVGKAKEMIYTAFNIKAEEAYRIGLVNAVYPQEELLAAAKKLANKIASNAPIAVRACKKAINEGLQVDMDQAIVVEEKAFGSCFETEDQKAGMGNFLEKDKSKKLKVVPFQNK